MNIRIVNYTPSGSPLVQAFVDVEVDGWLRFNGLNFLRDGTLKAAQLTPMCNRKRLYRDAVQILNADLAKLLAADILGAIQAHIALLPLDQRELPPLVPKQRAKPNQPPAAQGSAAPIKAAPVPIPSAPLAAAPVRSEVRPSGGTPGATKLKPLAPPQRLMPPRLRRPLADEK